MTFTGVVFVALMALRCFRQRGYSRFRVANIKSDYEKFGSATAVELHFSLPFHIPGRQASVKAIPRG